MSGIHGGSISGHTDILWDSVQLFFTKCLKVEDDTQVDTQGHPETVETVDIALCLHCMLGVRQKKGGGLCWGSGRKPRTERLSFRVCPQQ